MKKQQSRSHEATKSTVLVNRSNRSRIVNFSYFASAKSSLQVKTERVRGGGKRGKGKNKLDAKHDFIPVTPVLPSKQPKTDALGVRAG